MARVTAKVDCFIDNGFRRAGESFNYEGPRIEELLIYPDVEYDQAEDVVERKLRPGRRPKIQATE